MSEPTELFARGLQWSYREYGLKGTVAFLAVVAAGYYLIDRNLDDVIAGDSLLPEDVTDSSGQAGTSGSSQ